MPNENVVRPRSVALVGPLLATAKREDMERLAKVTVGSALTPMEVKLELARRCPGAEILEFNANGLQPVAYDDVEGVSLYRHFLRSPRQYLDQLFRD